MNTRQYPDFYLVGAPKCGTTAYYEFLRQHPEIFLPRTKELLRFGSDLSYPTRLSESDFLAHFSDRRDEQRVGTAHTAYLQSTRAAEEIKVHRPDADIVVMLRNPVDMVPSWHSELLYETIEDIEDLESALDAEEARRRGEQIPRSAGNSYVESLYYSEVAAFSEQVKRYFDVFGRSRVHVIIHDDLRADPAATYRRDAGLSRRRRHVRTRLRRAQSEQGGQESSAPKALLRNGSSGASRDQEAHATTTTSKASGHECPVRATAHGSGGCSSPARRDVSRRHRSPWPVTRSGLDRLDRPGQFCG